MPPVSVALDGVSLWQKLDEAQLNVLVVGCLFFLGDKLHGCVPGPIVENMNQTTAMLLGILMPIAQPVEQDQKSEDGIRMVDGSLAKLLVSVENNRNCHYVKLSHVMG